MGGASVGANGTSSGSCWEGSAQGDRASSLSSASSPLGPMFSDPAFNKLRESKTVKYGR